MVLVMEYSMVTEFEDLVSWWAGGRKTRRKARWKRKIARDVVRATMEIYTDEFDLIENIHMYGKRRMW